MTEQPQKLLLSLKVVTSDIKIIIYTECYGFSQRSKMIIFESHLTTFEARFIFLKQLGQFQK